MKNNSDHLLGKVPPQAIEVEEAVLGALMIDVDAFSTISPFIGTQSFYIDKHQKIFGVIKLLHDSNKPIDLITVTQRLKDLNQLEEIGGPAVIAKLTNVSSGANIVTYAKIIAEKHFAREMISKASDIIKLAYEDIDVDELGHKWRNYGDQLEDVFFVGNEGLSISHVLKETLKEIEADCVRVKENQLPGITTGFKSLDALTGGWRPGNMTILGARPSVGKTSVALHFAIHAARAGYWVNFFSLEMRSQDIARILIAAETNIYRSNIRDGYLDESDWQKIHSVAIPKLEKLPFIFCDINGLDISDLKSNVRKNRKRGKCDLVIVDYVQLVNVKSTKSVREQEVAEVTKTLKSITLSEGIPVIALSQLTRIEETKEPTLMNLRESGALEQDADNVIFLHRPDIEHLPDAIRVTFAKHRFGRKDQIDIFANSDRTLFYENIAHNNSLPAPRKTNFNPDEHTESKYSKDEF